ncbi:hypothetical protein [Zavarzinia aquatilis]|uniref:Uncharacterized protein n=1 Tax=Zavarzinia aquatilis TaxID=2211142 RepID=A0A317EEL0_9PROT|nr:hypothetical protein [Zavarzinia aquatilis]PWR25478.1 hypothetical protein DKG74_00420 [Zavarzinia aquatilis]
MILLALYLLGLCAMAVVPLAGSRALLTGIRLPRRLRADGLLPPLIAARSAEIGRRIGALSLEAVGPLKELAVALGPEDIAAAVNEAFAAEREAILHRVAGKHLGVMWRGLPGAAKVQFEDHLARNVPRAIDKALVEIVAAIDDLIDVPAMQERYFGARPLELSRMIAVVATPCFRALAVVLPALALLPLLLPAFAPGLLPMLAGAIMGYGASRLAVDWLFLPPPAGWRFRLPRRCLTPLLPERAMITTLYADTVADESFRLDIVIDELVAGRGAIATRAIVERRVAAIFARLPGRLLLNLVVSPRAMQGMIESATSELLNLLTVAAREPALVGRCAGRLRHRVRERLDAMDELAFLTMQRNVLRSELPLLHGIVAGVFLVIGLVAALL